MRARIKSIRSRLEKVRKSRNQSRQARRQAALPTVSLVGYTNAGKSTLFNALTQSSIYTADKLFATLDPTMRKVDIPGSAPIILADTVGFIRDLPHNLVDAFHATLEETEEANLLLQVIDVSDPNWREQVQAVESVLQEIEADDIPRIWVFNKIDNQPEWHAKVDMSPDRTKVWLSAQTGEGLDLLKDAMVEKLYGGFVTQDIYLTHAQSKLRSKLFELGAVLEESEAEQGGWQLKVRLSEGENKKLFKSKG